MNANVNDVELVKSMWDQYHPIYMECILKNRPDFYEFFSNGGVDDEFEFRLLGDVSGLALLDTCCACDASQAFSWTNLGARVTACDISPVAIEIAKANAIKIGLTVDLQVVDAQTLAPIPDNSYDVVYATYICWYEDIRTACKNWYRVLKSGGRLLYKGTHPVTNCLEENEGTLSVNWHYLNREPDYYLFEATPAGQKHGVNMNVPTVNFHHPLADLINAVADAGFRIERMRETEGAPGSPNLSKLPGEIAIIARKL